MLQLRKWQEESRPQPDLEPVKQCQRVITLEQHLFISLKKRDATLDYARTNNLHVMWNGGVIDTCDDRDFLNAIFQFKHLNKITIGLEMFNPFRYLHWEDMENFITSVIQAIGSFLIHEESLWKLMIVG